ncbi:MAG: adenylate/guanylate cyclase domain-containing protein [Marmoricola sp.]
MSATPRIGYAPRGDGGHIGYSVLGDGPPVIFWAGAMVSAAALFDEPRLARVQRQIATYATRIVLDRRGLGYSDPLPSGEPPTLERQAGDVLAVLDHLGVDRAVVIGNNWDCQAMLHLAAHYPERVEKLVLASATPCPMSRPDWPHGLPLEAITAVVSELDAPGQGNAPQILDLLAPSSNKDADLQAWLDTAGRTSPTTARAYLEIGVAADVRDLLPRISQPTLVVHSTGDRWIPIEVARATAELIPNARLVEIDSSDHLFFTDRLDERLAAIEEFIVGGPRAHAQRRLLTVLFTDVVGSTERLAEIQDAAWTTFLDEIDDTVARHVHRNEGRVCKSMGDGHLALFERPSDAVAAARGMVRSLDVLGAPIRAGLHIGEVELRGDDVAGLAVHIGARVSGKAQAGEVLVTRTVGDLLAGSPYAVEPAGEHELKGVPGTWNLFRVVTDR